MSRIRKKLEADPKNPRIIKTVYGIGYMLTTDVLWQSA
jgi:DNA-binding response OmpR family regulator